MCCSKIRAQENTYAQSKLVKWPLAPPLLSPPLPSALHSLLSDNGPMFRPCFPHLDRRPAMGSVPGNRDCNACDLEQFSVSSTLFLLVVQMAVVCLAQRRNAPPIWAPPPNLKAPGPPACYRSLSGSLGPRLQRLLCVSYESVPENGGV